MYTQYTTSTVTGPTHARQTVMSVPHTRREREREREKERERERERLGRRMGYIAVYMYTSCCIGSIYVVLCTDTSRMGDANCQPHGVKVHRVYKKHVPLHRTDISSFTQSCLFNRHATQLMYVHECMLCIG